MRKFHISRRDISEDKIKISDNSLIHHIRDVLRMKAGDDITVFDERGSQYHCRLDSISGNMVLRIKSSVFDAGEKRIQVTVACAIPKNSKFDDIVDKLTQLGADRIIPLSTRRVVVRLHKDRIAGRQLRWQKIAVSASQQSQRNSVPVIDGVTDMEDILSQAHAYDLKLIPTLEGRRIYLKEALSGSAYKNILFLIGPEGDFTPEEIAQAIAVGFIPISLGEFVLRVETAAVAVLSFVRFWCD